MKIRTDILLRVYLSYAIMFFVASAIVFQIFKLQQFQGKKWKQISDSVGTEMMNVEAVRGNILSDDGSLLATSLPEYGLRMDLRTESLTDGIFEDKVDSLGAKLAGLFQDKTGKEYTRKIRTARQKGDRYFLLKRAVSYPQMKAVKTFPIFNMGKYKGGLLIIRKNKRIQPFKELAARTIGYKVDGVNPVGLEGAFDKKLGGESGKRLMQRIAGGTWMPINEEDEVAPKDGYDVITTIDVNIQDVAQHALLKQLTKHDADHGCVVLMEVQTGEIKAIANYTRIETGVYVEKYNYVIGESMEPGSTFKLASFIAALEDGKFTLEDTVDTQGGKVRFYNHTLSDSHEGGYGVIDMRRAFEASSNVAIAKMINKGYKEDPDQFIKRLRSMGLGKPLGLEIPGEGAPRIKDSEAKDWSGLSLPLMSVGYEVKLTPLQTLALYNAIANDGKMVAPRLVSELQSMGKTVEKFPVRVIKKQVCSPSTVMQMRSLMEGVVKQGTAKNLSTTVYTIAGKTGTAQIAQGAQGYKLGKRIYQASFAGYFPAEKPEYSMIVVINNPSAAGYYGNVVAGPIFKEIADKVYATSLQMHSDLERDTTIAVNDIPLAKSGHREKTLEAYKKIGVSANASSDDDWVYATRNDRAVKLNAKTTENGLVPDVRGMGLLDAVYLIENNGLRAIVKGSGKVVRQSLAVGSRVVKGNSIVLELN